MTIVIPVLNEAESIVSALEALAPCRLLGHELIVVDGGSRDRTEALARPLVDSVLRSAPGRARQMNVGATAASGSILVFLHADTRLPAAATHAVVRVLQTHIWGRFDVRLSGDQMVFRVVERMITLRSRWTGIATGDQAMFVRTSVFREIGGFPEIPLMEDVALSKRLKRTVGRPACIKLQVETSSRRWESHGIVRTIIVMWGLRLAYALGVAPDRLARLYHPHRPRP